jgi:hypothetical protein
MDLRHAVSHQISLSGSDDILFAYDRIGKFRFSCLCNKIKRWLTDVYNVLYVQGQRYKIANECAPPPPPRGLGVYKVTNYISSHDPNRCELI